MSLVVYAERRPASPASFSKTLSVNVCAKYVMCL